jgi:nitronate monooxygenase/enoyl-[acyl-carrier protein] reductase II
VLPSFNLPQVEAAFAPRALRTPFTDHLAANSEPVPPDEVAHLVAEIRAGRGHDEIPFTGQSVELIHDLPSADELVARLVRSTTEALDLATSRAPTT